MSAPPESPQEADPRQLRELQSELEETARWMRESFGLARSPLHESDAELREACGKIVDALIAGHSPLDAALEHVLEARRHAILAIIRRVTREAYVLRERVEEGFLQERFPGGQYGEFFRLIDDAAELAAPSENSVQTRAKLFVWARETFPILRDMFGQLRASETAIIKAKAEKDWEQKRDRFRFRMVVGLTVALAVIGWLVAAILAWF